jgi:ubiquinone/menaquinone biosynthesis C-methylase UbiE
MEGEHRPTSGGALDLGCGHGVVTTYLARYLRPSVGVDIAHAAVVQARETAEKADVPAHFAVVEAPALPFRSESFGLVFDRGCLQAIPRPAWPRYFHEVQRLLKPGGHLWLYCSTVAKTRLMTRRRLQQMLGRIAQGQGSASLSETILQHLPSSMETVEIEDRTFRTPAGRDRVLVYGLFRKG